MKFFWRKSSPTERHLDRKPKDQVLWEKGRLCLCGVNSTDFSVHSTNTMGWVTCSRCGKERRISEAFNQLAQEMMALRDEMKRVRMPRDS